MRLVTVIVEARVLDQTAMDRTAPQGSHRQIRDALASVIRKALGSRRVPTLSTVDHDRVIALIVLPPDQPARPLVSETFTEICRQLAVRAPSVPVYAGVSEAQQPEGLTRAFEEADEALDFAIRVARVATIAFFPDLGVQHLLIRMGEGPQLARYVRAELGAVLNHDQRNSRTPLLPTLRAYCESGGNKNLTARSLHIQRRSLYHRLAKIEGLLGKRLVEGDSLLRAWLAVHALDLTRQRRLDPPDDSQPLTDVAERERPGNASSRGRRRVRQT
jgi:purine catabolism regulator